ncbi:hypothetical protein KUCAC02_009457, partial [Chaenocephalus aceratus]
LGCILAQCHIHAFDTAPITTTAHKTTLTESYSFDSIYSPSTPGHKSCYHCAAVMINHVLLRLALFKREGTNHTPHYPGLVTPKRSSPRTLSLLLSGDRDEESKLVCIT